MTDGFQSLTDKEKETLRLLLRGYDAKSIARDMDLSVHTIHERLRNARQKLSVSSSREAARLLDEIEQRADKKLGDKEIGDDPAPPAAIELTRQQKMAGSPLRHPAVIAGVSIMSLMLVALLATTMSPSAETAPMASKAAATEQADSSVTPPADAAILKAANDWLALVDAHDWPAAYNATAKSFRELNTLERWTEVAGKVQPQLGKTVTRDHRSSEFVPAPPYGYQMLKFKSSFEKSPVTTETLTLVEEDGVWKVTGYWLD